MTDDDRLAEIKARLAALYGGVLGKTKQWRAQATLERHAGADIDWLIDELAKARAEIRCYETVCRSTHKILTETADILDIHND